MSYFVFIAEVLMDIYLFFLDFKFWKKKRAQRKYAKENGLPKKRMIYPSDKIYLKVLVLSIILAIPVSIIISLLNINDYDLTEKRIDKIQELLTAEKKAFTIYPKQLKTIIRNNPFRKNLTKDQWDNLFYYSTSDDGLTYKLVSKGPDGILNTKDDIK
ncbi:hypothetical protein [uncultured Olleya sp.]|uniref:hypothetical protein n=1 Tax=uncultured Olleya sp. TaxID=757243 RepID=UPI0025947354|nr:hypothetical protein [uncultured Olleya sp.]